MKHASALSEPVVHHRARPVLVPELLVNLEPWHKVFLRNFADLMRPRRQPPLRLASRPGTFWQDVFVASHLPWRRFLESIVYHVALVATLWGAAQLWPHQPQVIERPAFTREDVVFYSPAEYLAPINTGATHVQLRQKGEPAHSPQQIISVPNEPDNRTQTIVTPPNIKLNHEVPLPNMVVWSQTQQAVPLAATERITAQLTAPSLPNSVIAPPPDVARTASHQAPALQQDVVAPPPTVEATSTRRLGDMNIGRSEVVAPAPQLPVAEQRTLASMAQPTLGNGSPSVVPPPPSMEGATNSNRGGGRIISLGIHPVAPSSAVEIPAGNRRGTFAATPEGKPGAPGTPDIAGTDHGTGSGISSGKNANGIPSGILVGAGPHSTDVAGSGHGQGSGTDSHLLASVTPPRVSAVPHHPASDNPTDVEKQVFGDRKFYSMILNMPNLNSAGGSWVIRFAEKQETGSGELVAPVAIHKADPAYPIELMRRNVQGTVTLYAIIRSDGSVSGVRVLRGVDDQLDEYARAALLRWHFSPATKNGNPVDLEAVVMIPFRLGRK